MNLLHTNVLGREIAVRAWLEDVKEAEYEDWRVRQLVWVEVTEVLVRWFEEQIGVVGGRAAYGR